MKPTSIDLRKRIVAARVQDGQSMGQIAERFGIAKGTVQNILERYRDAGTLEPKPPNAGRKAAFEPKALKRLERDVRAHPDATLAELRDRSGLAVSLVTVHNTLHRLGFTRKKSLYERSNSAGPMLIESAASGKKRSRTSILRASSSSTKPAQRRT
ncbi:MAG: transposase [Deltaproteobacteria bacterium]|nr:transposase [Deltaproteobacteria bacterium]